MQKTIKNRNNMLNIVELFHQFNQLKQAGKGFKILTPNQMLSRLPMSLAQLNARNNPEKRKNEISQLLILCTDQKNLPKKSINIRLTLFKHGNNLYEH